MQNIVLAAHERRFAFDARARWPDVDHAHALLAQTRAQRGSQREPLKSPPFLFDHRFANGTPGRIIRRRTSAVIQWRTGAPPVHVDASDRRGRLSSTGLNRNRSPAL